MPLGYTCAFILFCKPSRYAALLIKAHIALFAMRAGVSHAYRAIVVALFKGSAKHTVDFRSAHAAFDLQAN